MILPVRPHFFFDKLPADCPPFIIPVPKRSTDSPTQLELAILIAVGRIVGIGPGKDIFEIGTYKGATALMLSLNFPGTADDPNVITLDLDLGQSADLLNNANVMALEGHSMAFDLSEFHGTCGMVFIDGAHDEQTAFSDSGRAVELLPDDGPAAIVWHDYDPDHWPGVVNAVGRFDCNGESPIYRVEDTRLAVYLRER